MTRGKSAITYQGLIIIKGIGAHVHATVINRKGFLPITSDKAPTIGALRNDNIPYKMYREIRQHLCDIICT